MSNWPEEFLEQWVENNVELGPYPLEDEVDPEAERLAANCISAAQQEGISKTALEQAAGEDLVAYMTQAMENAANAELERQLAKDNLKER